MNQATVYSAALDCQVALVDFWQSWRGRETATSVTAQMLRGAGSAPTPQDFCRGMVHELFDATPYFVSTAMLRLWETAAADLPDLALAPSMVPAPSGFVYLETPWVIDASPWPPGSDQPDALAAFSWEQGAIRTLTRTDQPHLMVSTYRASLEGGIPQLASAIEWPYGEPWEGWGRPDNWPTTEKEGPVYRPQRGRSERRAVLAFFLLVAQKLWSTVPHAAAREVRRRAARLLPDLLCPQVEVVQLRRRVAASGPEVGTREVEWSCQWFVQGHWRQQWYPSTEQHRPIWVLPYVKGPEDKPLKPPSTKLFAVVR